MAGGGEDGVCGGVFTPFEMAAAEISVGLHVTDDGFYGRPAPEFALDGAEDAAFLARDEDAAGAELRHGVAAIALVDIGAFDLAAGELGRLRCGM